LAGTDLLQGSQSAFFWSPDSKHVAYFADGKLKRIDISGGQPETICNAPGGSDGDWNRDDVIVFGSEGSSGPLYRVPASGGNPMPVVTPEASAPFLTSPQFLPDGRRFLYTAATRRYAGAADSPETSEIHVADLDSKERRRVLTGRGYVRYAPPGFLLYATSRALMVQPFDGVRAEITGDPFQIVEVSQAAFSVSQNGVLAYSRSAPLPTGQVTWFDRSGREIATITTPGVFYQPVVSPDRKLVALEPGRSAGSNHRHLAVRHGARDIVPIHFRSTVQRVPDVVARRDPHRLLFLRGGTMELGDEAGRQRRRGAGAVPTLSLPGARHGLVTGRGVSFFMRRFIPRPWGISG
jgi:hypothetical protein